MNGKIFGDWGIKGAALALAVLFWFHAVTEPPHQYEKELKIRMVVEDPEPISESEELIVANKVPAFAQVLVAGTGKKLFGLTGESFVLRVRPKGSLGSVRLYKLTSDQVENVGGADPQVDIRQIIDPTDITIRLDRRAEREVEVQLVGEPTIAESYTQVGEIQIDPPVIRVVGPGHQVSQLESIKTDSLKLANLSEDVKDYHLALNPPDTLRLELSPEYVTIRVDVQELAEYVIANVPVGVRSHVVPIPPVVPEPSRVEVQVKGGADHIASLDAVRDIKLYVDYTEWLLSDGKSQKILFEETDRFEIMRIIPARVNLVSKSK